MRAPAGIERLLAQIPAEHRAAIGAAVEQWQCAMWLAAQRHDPDAAPAHGADPASAPVLRAYARLLEALAGEPLPGVSGRPVRDDQVALARAFGEIAGTLARLALDAAASMAPVGDASESARALYDEYVEQWETRYREWMLTDGFARLQGELCNSALALRKARAGGRR